MEPTIEELDMAARMYREQNEPDYDDPEARQRRELAQIRAMMDGFFVSIDFRGLTVSLNERMQSAVVMTPEGRRAGGQMSLEHATVAGVHDWLEAKADLYGGV